MNVTITPSKLSGTITPPPSKSQAHRLIIAAALAGGESVLDNIALSQDISATIACMEELGAEFSFAGSRLTVRGAGISERSPTLRSARPRMDCGESGSTLRFLIPVALAARGGGTFTGRGRLMERPQQPYFDLFDQKDIAYECSGSALTVRGDLAPGDYALPGNVSSQFITGLLYALPLLPGESTLRITTPLESADYVAMTLQALEQFGVAVERTGPLSYRIPGGQVYRPRSLAVEADWSQAAFWYAAAGLGNAVTVAGMNPGSLQGDKEILHWGRMIAGQPMAGGADVSGPGRTGENGVFSGGGRSSAYIDVSPCPDLVPPAAAWGTGMRGELHLCNARRLRMKESDRLAAVSATLAAMGARVEEEEDGLTICGAHTLAGGCTVDCWGDHRIAMMAAVAATRCAAPVTLVGAECVAKSYPAFWDDYEALGGRIVRSE